MVAADVCDLLWYHDEEGLYANLFAPSTVEWEHTGTGIRIEERTSFPGATEVSFLVRVPSPTTFALRVRARLARRLDSRGRERLAE